MWGLVVHWGKTKKKTFPPSTFNSPANSILNSFSCSTKRRCKLKNPHKSSLQMSESNVCWITPTVFFSIQYSFYTPRIQNSKSGSLIFENYRMGMFDLSLCCLNFCCCYGWGWSLPKTHIRFSHFVIHRKMQNKLCNANSRFSCSKFIFSEHYI